MAANLTSTAPSARIAYRVAYRQVRRGQVILNAEGKVASASGRALTSLAPRMEAAYRAALASR